MKTYKTFNLTTSEGAAEANRFVDLMTSSIDFPKRHKWLLSRGWRFLGHDEKRALYANLDIDPKGESVNQSKAMRMTAWAILEQRGMLIRAPRRFAQGRRREDRKGEERQAA